MPNVSNASKDKFYPKCGKQFADYVAFCIDCGTKLLEQEINEVYCKNCGATIKEEAKYCPKCGTKREV